MWVARNKIGGLQLLSNKPYREIDHTGRYPIDRWNCKGDFTTLDDETYGVFPELKWEDEPIEVELVVKNNKEN